MVVGTFRARSKADHQMQAAYAHVWRMRDGKAVSFHNHVEAARGLMAGARAERLTRISPAGPLKHRQRSDSSGVAGSCAAAPRFRRATPLATAASDRVRHRFGDPAVEDAGDDVFGADTAALPKVEMSYIGG